jgi:hypothetical protein
LRFFFHIFQDRSKACNEQNLCSLILAFAHRSAEIFDDGMALPEREQDRGGGVHRGGHKLPDLALGGAQGQAQLADDFHEGLSISPQTTTTGINSRVF